MKWLYKIFVSDSELLGALPLFYHGKRTTKDLDRFVNDVRKQLFIGKTRKFLKALNKIRG